VELNAARTLNNILMDPARCTIYITKGNPCRKQWVPVWVGDALRMEWADGARDEIDYAPEWRPAARTRRIDVFRRPYASDTSDWMRSIGLRFFGGLDRLMASAMVSPPTAS
jgi:hypothetical protein